MVLASWATTALGHARRFLVWRPFAQLCAGGVAGSLLFAPVALGLDLMWPVDSPAGMPEDLLDQWEAGGGGLALVAEWLSLAPPYVASWLLVNVVPMARNSSASLADHAGGHVVQGASPADRRQFPQASAAPAAPSGERQGEFAAGDPATAGREMPETDPPPGAEGEPSPETFLALLPPAIGSDLVSIQADLHYLQVRTTRGRATILASMATAEAALGKVGLRVHRSYWIALAHVVRLSRTARGTFLILSDGERVPVSRRRASDVQARIGRDFVVDSA